MNFSRRPLWLLAALCVVLIGPGGQSLFAQDSLPSDILAAADDLTTQQQAKVDTFLQTQIARLQSEDPEQVATGRARLAEPFTLSNSEFFLSYYRKAIAQRVTPLLKPDSPLMTRLNVAIVSSKLSGQSLVAVLQAGADDPSPAVRYWIAKAVGSAAKNKRLDKQAQQNVLQVIANRLKAEDSSLVLEQVMLAMAEIELKEATQAVLEGLDARVSFYKQNMPAPFKPVHGGTQQLWSKLIEMRSANENVDSEQKELARIAFRYYALVADQLAAADEDDLDDEAKNDKSSMAWICGRVMDDVAKAVAKINPPQPVDTKNAAELKVSVERWREILKAAPFNYSDEQLAVSE